MKKPKPTINASLTSWRVTCYFITMTISTAAEVEPIPLQTLYLLPWVTIDKN